jgi:hypothetical protein
MLQLGSRFGRSMEESLRGESLLLAATEKHSAALLVRVGVVVYIHI